MTDPVYIAARALVDSAYANGSWSIEDEIDGLQLALARHPQPNTSALLAAFLALRALEKSVARFDVCGDIIGVAAGITEAARAARSSDARSWAREAQRVVSYVRDTIAGQLASGQPLAEATFGQCAPPVQNGTIPIAEGADACPIGDAHVGEGLERPGVQRNAEPLDVNQVAHEAVNSMPRDSDGSPKGGDVEGGSVHDSADPEGIAQGEVA